MGANRFMSPQRTKYFQTYVDQHVPMPFETMAVAMGTRQKVHDDVQNNLDTALAINLEVDQKDVADRDAIIKGYENKADELVESVNGDYSQLRGDISTLTREIKKDLTMGNLAGMHSQYLGIQADRKRKQEYVDNGFDEGGGTSDRAGELLSASYNKYQGYMKGSRYSAMEAAAQYDTDRIAKELLEDWKSDALQSGKWKSENGVLMKKYSGGYEKAAADEIYKVALNKLQEHPALRAEWNQMKELGYNDEQIEASINNAAWRASEIYGYTKENYDQDIKFTPDYILSGAGEGPAAPLTIFNESVSVDATLEKTETIASMIDTFTNERKTLDAKVKRGDLQPWEAANMKKELDKKILSYQGLMRKRTNNFLDTPAFKTEYLNKHNGELSRADKMLADAILLTPSDYLSKEDANKVKQALSGKSMLNDSYTIINDLISKENIVPTMSSEEFLRNEAPKLLLEMSQKDYVSAISPGAQGIAVTGHHPKVSLFNSLQNMKNNMDQFAEATPIANTSRALTSVDNKGVVFKVNEALTEEVANGTSNYTLPNGKQLDTYLREELPDLMDAGIFSDDSKYDIKIAMLDEPVIGSPGYQLTVIDKNKGATKINTNIFPKDGGWANMDKVGRGLIKENLNENNELGRENIANGINMAANVLFKEVPQDVIEMQLGRNKNDNKVHATSPFKIPIADGDGNVVSSEVKIESYKGSDGTVYYRLVNSKNAVLFDDNDEGDSFKSTKALKNYVFLHNYQNGL